MISIPGKIPIRIFPFFWLLIFMIGWFSSGTIIGTVLWALIIFFSILIHEYGHALTALAFGQQAEIDLVGLGGLTRRTGAPLKRWQEFLIVLNGPLAGFFLFFFVDYLALFTQVDHLNLVAYSLQIAMYVNLIWNALNLLPVQPLDGGHLLKILLEGALGLKGVKISFLISIVLATALSLFFFLIQSLLAGALFLMMAFESYRSWKELKSMTPQDANAQLQETLKEAQEDLQAGRSNDALSKFLFLRDQAKEGVLFVLATQLGARVLAEQGQFEQAYQWLYPIKSSLSPDYSRLLQQLAYRLQKWNEVVIIGNQSYQQDPAPHTALLNAFSYAIVGKPKQAVGWLQSAAKAGIPNVADLIKRREFDAIRESAEFQAFAKPYQSEL